MPTEDYNPRASVTAVGVTKGPTTAVAEGLLIELDRELTPEESPMPRRRPAPDTSEGSVSGRSHRSQHQQRERQDSSQASNVDSAPVCSNWWDTNSESDPQTDLARFSYTSFRH